MRRTFVLTALVALAACKRDRDHAYVPPPLPVDTREPPPATAPAIAWTGTQLTTAGHPDWKLAVRYDEDGAGVTTSGARWPKDTKLVARDVDQPIEHAALVPIASAFGGVKVWHMDAEKGELHAPDVDLKPAIPLVIRFSNGVEIKTTLPPAKVEYHLVDGAMKYAKDHALTFDDEPKHEGAHSVFWLHGQESSEVSGPAKLIQEVDRLAVVKSTITAGPHAEMCKYDLGAYPLELDTMDVTVYERTTHTALGTKTFAPASVSCPSTALGGRALVGPDRAAIYAWAKKL